MQNGSVVKRIISISWRGASRNEILTGHDPGVILPCFSQSTATASAQFCALLLAWTVRISGTREHCFSHRLLTRTARSVQTLCRTYRADRVQRIPSQCRGRCCSNCHNASQCVNKWVGRVISRKRAKRLTTTAMGSLVERKRDLAIELAFRAVWIALHQRVLPPVGVFEVTRGAEARSNSPHCSVALGGTAIVNVPCNVALATAVRLPPNRAAATCVARSEGAHRASVTVYTLIEVHRGSRIKSQRVLHLCRARRVLETMIVGPV